MRYLFLSIACLAVLTANCQRAHPERNPAEKSLTISREKLEDKIRGGWAGQTIGVTFGGPTEFRFCGTMIQEYQPIYWSDTYIKETMQNNPTLYDDIYMDLTFVDVFEKFGLDAATKEFEQAYANAGYVLWHANQVGRNNILNGMSSPQSGHWLNNPHADCIDYQIESDFAGLMSPGMPNTASSISDRIGHIMNYGDGWYGGVYMGAMYSLAFTSQDINYIVEESLKTIPRQSKFHNVIADVIRWHKAFPNDWKRTWFEIQRKWTSDNGCPDGVFAPFDIDATVNAAYVVLGLLYGNGDFDKTMDIATRAGQDSDCNPSSAGGILGTVLGYSKIPLKWKTAVVDAEDLAFMSTDISLKKVYEIGFKHAVENVMRNGGTVQGDDIVIKVQTPVPVQFEQSFTGHYPVEKRWIGKELTSDFSIDFEGIGFVIKGSTSSWGSTSAKSFKVALYIDGALSETATFPASYLKRRQEIFWKYQMQKGKHEVTLKLLESHNDEKFMLSDIIVYSDVFRTGDVTKQP